MGVAVFGRVGGADDEAGVEEAGFADAHAGFDAVGFGFDGGGEDAAVGAVVGGYGHGLAAQERIGLLFDSGEAGVEVDVHDGWRSGVEVEMHKLMVIWLNCFIVNVRKIRSAISGSSEVILNMKSLKLTKSRSWSAVGVPFLDYASLCPK